MIKVKGKKRGGFVLLFAVTLTGILLAVALGVSHIALKELNFSTSARDTGDAFSAADTAAECALYYDRFDVNRFAYPDPGGSIICAGSSIPPPTFSGDSSVWTYTFNVLGLGNNSQSCARVNVYKDDTIDPFVLTTIVTSRGYNLGGDATCNSVSTSLVERKLEISYGVNLPGSGPPPEPPPLPTNYTVTGTAGANGTISPASQQVASGNTTTLTVTPNSGYTASASGCSGSLAGTTYTTGAITADCTVAATFNAIPPVTYVRANGTGGSTSTTLDIGSAGSNRLVVVIAGLEGTTNLTGATVDGKACLLARAATNTAGVGNRSEMWYCDEDNLGSSSGTVTVAIQGGSTAWAVHALLFTGASQSGPADTSTDTTSVTPTTTTTMAGMDVPAGGAIVIGVGNGTQALNVSSWTSPVTTRFSAADPTSADLVSASGIESSVQTNKTYQATWSSAPNRSSGVAASWAKAQ